MGATFKELANAIKTTYQDIISFDPINLLENIAPPTSTSNSNSIVGS
ncbi:MAG: hypothetical protein J6W64_05860 [Bacilli bacterium]|nr:hypothetical protein [Bacilli bacterium]